MGCNPEPEPIIILYIGRAEAGYERVWRALRRDGYETVFARTQAAGLQMARELRPRIIVVNDANGHFSGERLCHTLSRRLPGAIRLLLLERGAADTTICDHSLVHPFTDRKLRDAILTLLNAASPYVLRVGDIQLDVTSRLVSSSQGRRRLTPKECDLLAGFLRRPNQVISRKELMESIWKTDYLGDTRTLDVHIRWLRQKIEVDPAHPVLLLTSRGVGYMLAAPDLDGAPDALPDEDF
jgi:DNA-binding response OmpR family regulator